VSWLAAHDERINTVTVRKLISLLKKMPQNLEVGVAAHDNSEWEVPAWPCSVFLFERKDFLHIKNEPMVDDAPDKCVVIRC
jgi:hypothetical protein